MKTAIVTCKVKAMMLGTKFICPRELRMALNAPPSCKGCTHWRKPVYPSDNFILPPPPQRPPIDFF